MVTITAQGIAGAFLDAERLVAPLDEAVAGTHSYDEAMSSYQQERDRRVMPMFEMMCRQAKLEPPPPEFMTSAGVGAAS